MLLLNSAKILALVLLIASSLISGNRAQGSPGYLLQGTMEVTVTREKELTSYDNVPFEVRVMDAVWYMKTIPDGYAYIESGYDGTNLLTVLDQNPESKRWKQMAERIPKHVLEAIQRNEPPVPDSRKNPPHIFVGVGLKDMFPRTSDLSQPVLWLAAASAHYFKTHGTSEVPRSVVDGDLRRGMVCKAQVELSPTDPSLPREISVWDDGEFYRNPKRFIRLPPSLRNGFTNMVYRVDQYTNYHSLRLPRRFLYVRYGLDLRNIAGGVTIIETSYRGIVTNVASLGDSLLLMPTVPRGERMLIDDSRLVGRGVSVNIGYVADHLLTTNELKTNVMFISQQLIESHQANTSVKKYRGLLGVLVSAGILLGFLIRYMVGKNKQTLKGL